MIHFSRFRLIAWVLILTLTAAFTTVTSLYLTTSAWGFQTEPVPVPIQRTAPAQPVNAWVKGGPYGGNISLTLGPASPVLYARSGTTIQRSTDAGSIWEPLETDLQVRNIGLLGINPYNPNVWHTPGNSEGIYRSTNGGVNWTLTSSRALNVLTYEFDPTEPEAVYIGDRLEGISKGRLNSAWVPLNQGLPSTLVSSFRAVPGNISVMFAGLNPSGFYKSTDKGLTWSAAGTGLPNEPIVSIAFDPNQPTTMYVCGNQVYRSTDGGLTFVAANNGINFVNQYFSLATDPFQSGTVLLGTNSGLFKTTNGGGSWTQIPTGSRLRTVGTVLADPQTPNRFYASDYVDGLYRSINGGVDWTSMNEGIPGQITTYLTVSPINPRIAFASCFTELFKTTDGGQSWNPVQVVNRELYPKAVAFDPQHPNTVYLSSGIGPPNMWKSTDGGATWAGQANFPSTSATMFAFDPHNTNVVYAGTESTGVQKSTDGGTTWNQKNNGLPTLQIQAVLVHPGNPNRLFAALANQGVARSTDGGNQWQVVNSGLTNLQVQSLALNPLAPDILLAAAFGGTIFKSSNGGDTWAGSSTGIPPSYFTAVVNDPAHPDTFFCSANDSGVFRTTDNGVSWNSFNTGLREKNVISLAVAGDGSALYAGTSNTSVSTFTFGPLMCQQFFPAVSAPGKSISIFGAGFETGSTLVFFGGKRKIPAAAIQVVSPNQLVVTVPPSGRDGDNINGYVTLQSNGLEVTSQFLEYNGANPGMSSFVAPEFILAGDVTGDGILQTNDLALVRAFLMFQASPTRKQALAADVVPVNPNGSRGDGQLTSTDFTFLRAVLAGQTGF